MGVSGHYYSASTYSENSSYKLYFRSDNVSLTNIDYRYMALSVRLVTDVK